MTGIKNIFHSKLHPAVCKPAVPDLCCHRIFIWKRAEDGNLILFSCFHELFSAQFKFRQRFWWGAVTQRRISVGFSTRMSSVSQDQQMLKNDLAHLQGLLELLNDRVLNAAVAQSWALSYPSGDPWLPERVPASDPCVLLGQSTCTSWKISTSWDCCDYS